MPIRTATIKSRLFAGWLDKAMPASRDRVGAVAGPPMSWTETQLAERTLWCGGPCGDRLVLPRATEHDPPCAICDKEPARLHVFSTSAAICVCSDVLCWWDAAAKLGIERKHWCGCRKR